MIIPSYRDTAALSVCLERLHAQVTAAPFEVIVSVSADTPGELPALAPDERIRVLTHVPRLLPGPARNAAVVEARGTVLLFADADVLVPPDWIEGMLGAWDGRSALVGAVANGTPTSATGTAEYLCEFLDFRPHREAGPIWHGATCNLLVPKTVWETYGPFPEVIGGEDTVFTHRLAREGLLRFTPDVVVQHNNRVGVRRVLAHQYQLGRHQVAIAHAGPHPWRWVLVRPALAPAAACARLMLIAGRVARSRLVPPRTALRSAPFVVAGLAAWAAGLWGEGRRRRVYGTRARRAMSSAPRIDAASEPTCGSVHNDE